MSAILAVHAGFYSTLAGDATLVALVAPNIKTGGPGVLNDVPEGQLYPHVLISGTREKAWHTFGGPTTGLGWELLVPVYSRSRYQGDEEALEIHNRCVTLLNFQPLTVVGFSSVTVEYAPGGDMTGQVMVLDVDKVETRQVLAEFRVRVRQ